MWLVGKGSPRVNYRRDAGARDMAEISADCKQAAPPVHPE